MNGKRGFTLVEMLVVVAMIALLAAIATAVSLRVRETARAVHCTGNLRQWGVALNSYMGDHGGLIPRRGQGVQPVFKIDRDEDWFNCLPPYLGLPPYEDQVASGTPARPGDTGVFVCPSAKMGSDYQGTHFLCYGMNMKLCPWDRPQQKLSDVGDVTRIAFMADAPGGWASTIPAAAPYSVQARHGGKANVVFMDGHVESFSGDYLGCGRGETPRSDIRWDPIEPISSNAP